MVRVRDHYNLHYKVRNHYTLEALQKKCTNVRVWNICKATQQHPRLVLIGNEITCSHYVVKYHPESVYFVLMTN